MNEAIILAIGTAFGCAVTALGKNLIAWRKASSKTGITDREQISKEYATLLEQLQERLEEERKEKQLAVGQMDSWRERLTECRVERERLQGENRFLTSQVNSLRAQEVITKASGWSEALVITDESGRVVEWNRASEILFRYTREEALAMTADRLFVESSRKPFRDAVSRQRVAPAERAGLPLPLTVLTRDGMELPAEVTLSGWFGPEGWYCGALVRQKSRPAPEQGEGPTSVPAEV
jgi:PAS domain S-box-containing protein